MFLNSLFYFRVFNERYFLKRREWRPVCLQKVLYLGAFFRLLGKQSVRLGHVVPNSFFISPFCLTILLWALLKETKKGWGEWRFENFLFYRVFFGDFSRGIFVFSPAGESAFLTLFFSTAIIEISFVYTEDTRGGEKGLCRFSPREPTLRIAIKGDRHGKF